MYKVESSDGFILFCKEESDAIVLADSLWQDSDRNATVVVSLNGREIYRLEG